jgi:nucleoside-diphosphate-sugar epimerase
MNDDGSPRLAVPDSDLGMKISITGAGGFLGRMLARDLLADARVERLVLADAAPVPGLADDRRLGFLQVNLAEPGAAESVVAGMDVVFHLAAVLSGQSESEFDLGMSVNVDATRRLLEAARAGGRCPRFVFTSSLAVFGPPLPVVVTEDTAVHPQSSYGAGKAIAELLIADYSRRGYVDGRVLRLPTICVRPGRPNAATSSFVSGIIREPLNGEQAVCPVSPELELWLSSPRSAVRNLAHAASLPAESVAASRIIHVPGISVTVAEMIASLRRVAGPEVAARIVFAEDPLVRRIVSSWPARLDIRRALDLGFVRDPGFDALIEEFTAHVAAETVARRS